MGKSGGQLIVWDTHIFLANMVLRGEYTIGIRGKWVHSRLDCLIINVYGPQDDDGKKKLWVKLSNFLNCDPNVACVFCGDFNEVRNESERFNCDLVEIPMSGRIFTRVSDDGLKFSKLDRFLVTDNFLHPCKDLTPSVLERHLSDHCVIVLKDEERNFGPKPFKTFDAWNKLKNVKAALKEWSKSKFGNLEGEIEAYRLVAQSLELKAEHSNLSELELEQWRNARKLCSKKRKWFKEIGGERPSLKDLIYPVLSDCEASGLEERFNEKEIHEAILECGSNKAPGPDGFNLRFFKNIGTL
ncbi:uncharacterized protein [Rutidosis leptorrhynchoides]|uniref:uncharacterized protein n=1 Tax=Rutidosis leptorrhynchoides TaxID=125765 RepID=UPI003A99AA62